MMEIKRLPLVYFGHPILRRKCTLVEKIDDEIKQLIADMICTMDANDGIGIAAPQVGHPLRIFVLRNYIEDKEGNLSFSSPRVYINPKLSNPSKETDIDKEGCISIPGIRLLVERPVKITIEATDLNGALFTEEVEGYNARVRMHENDHLNGVLFIDRVDALSRREIEASLRQIKKQHSSN